MGNAGWVVLWVSGIFGVVPIVTLRRHGQVPPRRSYVHTTVVVDRGLYAVVRHPQYLAGNYLSTFDEERDLRERFGADYEAYCQRVPRIDAATGFLRYLRRTT